MIDMVNFIITFLSLMTLLRWLIFLLGSLTVNLIVLLFWTSSDASICSTMAFPSLENSDHVVVSVSTDFPLNSKQDAEMWSKWDVITWEMFHGKISLGLVLLLLLVNFVSRFMLELMYIIICLTYVSCRASLTTTVFSSLCCCHSS